METFLLTLNPLKLGLRGPHSLRKPIEWKLSDLALTELHLTQLSSLAEETN